MTRSHVFLKNFLLIGLVVATASCASYTSRVQLDELNRVVAVGSPFTQRLTQEYRDLATYDQKQIFNYINAEHFARKGLRAAKGEIVPPENPTEWKIDADNISDLSDQRQKLVDLLDNGGRESAPEMAAVAQARFDCWVERSEVSKTLEDPSVCHSQFTDAMEQLNAAIQSAGQPQKQASQTDLNSAMFLVFFDSNKAAISKKGLAVIETVASEGRRMQASRMNVVGYTDLSGSARANLKISLKRAQTVKTILVKDGVPASIIHIDGQGENHPIVPTAKGIKEPANRRVEITFQ